MGWSAHERERLLALCELLEQARTTTTLVMGRIGWQPVAGSRLAFELANNEHGPAGPWGRAPVERAWFLAQFWLILGTVELANAAAVLTIEMDRLPQPWANARAAIEKFAGVCWLLEPALDTRARAARSAVAEAADRRQARNAAAYAEGAEPGSHRSPESEAYDTYITGLGGVFEQIETTKGTLKIEGEAWPGYTDLVDGFVRRFLRGGSGREAYSVLSARTHPSTTAIHALAEWLPGGGMRLRERFNPLEKLVRLCVAAHYVTQAQALNYYDVVDSADSLQFWEDAINEVLPETIVAGEPRSE